MKDKYVDLINQTFDFPVDEFGLNEDKELTFHDIPLMDLVEQYGTPLKFTYLPRISENIKKDSVQFSLLELVSGALTNLKFCAWSLVRM